MHPISITILTKNSQKYLMLVLEALKTFDEVIIFDNGSTDQTLTIAKTFPNVKVIEGQFIGFGPTHNLVSRLAKNDWILSIDSDEIMSNALVEEIQKLYLDKQSVYSIARHNEFNGKWIRWCGWHPERVVRIYNRKVTQFSEAFVHEGIQTKNLKLVPLKGHLRHLPYASVSDFLVKMQMYTDLFANEHQGKKKSSPLKAALHSVWAFFRSYFLKKGFLGGYEGYLISVYNGQCAFYKYMKLYEANQRLSKS